MTGERELIKKIKDWTIAAGVGGRRIGDDCAVLAGQDLVSSDMLVEGRHFDLRFTDFVSLGWKSCAVNLSDIAAMAGRPRYLTVSLSLPPYISESNVRDFYTGFNACARAYRTEVVGGDLTGGEKLVIAVTVMGVAHENGLLRRSGARVGDVVLVTGGFGASALGLRLLQGLSDIAFEQNSTDIGSFRDCCKTAQTAHLRPLPRICEAYALVRRVGNRGALIDASDGLADGLFHIAEASNVSMKVYIDKIPIDPDVRGQALALKIDPIQLALYGGEDYELVACADRATLQQSVDLFEGHFPFTEIGEVIAQNEAGKPTVALCHSADIGLNREGTPQSFVDLSNCYQHFW